MKLAYLAYDKSGKKVRDSIEASNPTEASDQLRRRGLFVTEIGAPGSAAKGGGRENTATPTSAASRNETRAAGKKMGSGKRAKCLMMFSRQLYVLVSTGTPLVDSLHAIERQAKDPAWRAVVARVKQQLEQGASLSEAMAEQPDFFDAVTRSLVAAGEQAGKLPAMLERVAQITRKQVHIRSSIIGAMVYPSLLIVVAGSVLCVMLMFVLPRFGDLFKTMDVPLPPTTKALMVVSDLMLGYWWLMILCVIGGGFGIRTYLKSESGRLFVHTAMIRMPQFGKITRSFATARIVRLMGILLDSYLPLLEVLKLVRESTVNTHYRALLTRAEEAVTRGEPISTAFNDPTLISSSVYEALHSGEQSGQIGTLMLSISDFLDEDNDVVIKSLTSIIEPVILLFLGALVGLVAVSMFMPLFDLTAMTGKG